MMARIRTTIIVALFLAAGSTQAQQPAWPQSFDLTAGATAHYAFAVTRPGEIVVTVQWAGVPLTIELTRPDGQKIPAHVGVSPGTLAALVTAADVANGASWQLDLQPTRQKVPPPNAGQRPPPDSSRTLGAKGTVSVQFPPLKLGVDDRNKLVPAGKPTKIQNSDVLVRVPPAPTPVVGPATGDPRGDPNRITLESKTKIDVAAANPSGKSLKQSLPLGLDGKPIPTTHRYGNAAADKMLAGHTNETSPLNMKRDPAAGGKLATGAAKGRDPLTDTLGRQSGVGAGGDTKSEGGSRTFVGGDAKTSGGGNVGPPPGAELGFRAPKGGLVGDAEDTMGFFGKKPVDYKEPSTAKRDPRAEFINKSGKVDSADAGTPELKKYVEKKNKYDTGEGNAVVVTEEAVARAVVLKGADTDFVEGYGAGSHIEGSAPPKRARDLVTDPSPEGDPTAVDITKAPKAPRGGGYTDPINPRDGFGSPSPSPQGPGGTAPGGPMVSNSAELKPEIVAADLGRAAYLRNDFAGAAAAFERSLALSPDNPEGRFELGLSYAQLGRNADAEQAFTAALTLRPNVARTHLELGKVLAKLGRQSEAAAQFRLASDLDPTGAVGEQSRSLLKPPQ